jgi:hypothetical protein
MRALSGATTLLFSYAMRHPRRPALHESSEALQSFTKGISFGCGEAQTEMAGHIVAASGYQQDALLRGSLAEGLGTFAAAQPGKRRGPSLRANPAEDLAVFGHKVFQQLQVGACHLLGLSPEPCAGCASRSQPGFRQRYCSRWKRSCVHSSTAPGVLDRAQSSTRCVCRRGVSTAIAGFFSKLNAGLAARPRW